MWLFEQNSKLLRFVYKNCMPIRISGQLKTWTFTSEGYESIRSVNNLNFSFDNNRKCPPRINRVTGSSSRLKPLPSSCQHLHLIREGRLVTQNHAPWTFAFLVIFSGIQIFIYYKNKKLNITKSQFQPQYKYFGKMKLLVQIARMLKQPNILILSSVWMLQ